MRFHSEDSSDLDSFRCLKFSEKIQRLYQRSYIDRDTRARMVNVPCDGCGVVAEFFYSEVFLSYCNIESVLCVSCDPKAERPPLDTWLWYVV